MRYFGCVPHISKLIEFICIAVCALIIVTTVSYEGWRQFHSEASN